MNVSELYELTFWIDEEIIKKKISQKYQTLQQSLQQNTRPNQQKQAFETQKDDLINSIKKIPLTKLTKEQLSFLEALGIEKAVGVNAVNTVNDILYKNSLDIATAAQKVQEIFSDLTQGIQKAKQMQTGLSGWGVIKSVGM